MLRVPSAHRFLGGHLPPTHYQTGHQQRGMQFVHCIDQLERIIIAWTYIQWTKSRGSCTAYDDDVVGGLDTMDILSRSIMFDGPAPIGAGLLFPVKYPTHQREREH